MVGGDRIKYAGKVATKTASLNTCKILFNSIISTDNVQFLGLDTKSFYLNTPMEEFEYMRLPMNIIPQEIIEQYNLEKLQEDGFSYIENSLPQVGILANELI